MIKREKPQVKFFCTPKPGEWNPYDLQSIVNFATDANQSVMLSYRAKDAQKTVLSKEERPGSSVPYGYKLSYPLSIDENASIKEKGKQIIDDGPSTIVLFIFYLASWDHSKRDFLPILQK